MSGRPALILRLTLAAIDGSASDLRVLSFD
jgi:hypothetical protein